MSTRSLTVFVDEHGQEFAVMYRHHDGYPTGHGADLVKWGGGDRRIVNGYSTEDVVAHNWNMMSQVAADCVRYFQEQQGPPPAGVSLYKAGTRDCWEEYVYTLSAKPLKTREHGLWLKVEDTYYEGHVLYEGWLREYSPVDEAE